MLTITTGSTGKVWQAADGGGSAVGSFAVLFCGRHSGSPDEIDAKRSSTPRRLLCEAATGPQPSVAD